ncbi:MAG: hypothetical protein VXA61_07760 [Candidatus Neomarinimicrobiota bacterium]
MNLKVSIIISVLNLLNLTFAEEQAIVQQDIKEYRISSEKYITDLDGNIKMNVNVWGHVQRPGNHLVFEGIDIVTLLSIVGGPQVGAKLGKIRLIREIPEENGQLVHTLNFNEFLNSGSRSNFIKIKPNDTIIVPQKFSSVLISGAGGVNTLLGLFTLYLQISRSF